MFRRGAMRRLIRLWLVLSAKAAGEMVMSAAVPIFVISYNRGDYLKRVIDSYQRQTVPVEIIVHDFGSNDPRTLSILSDLERTGTRVNHAARILSGAQLNQVDQTVQQYFQSEIAQTRYVVTDCDIDLTIASPDSLLIYNELLDRFSEVECVGPMLRISDVPKAYPLYNRVMNRHIEQFWHREPDWFESEYGKKVGYLLADIDTTFALHRERKPFRRLKHGIRVYFPYEAQHLDWYQSPKDLDDSEYYRSSFEGIGNWSNKVSHAKFSAEKLQHANFIYVEPGPDGRLQRQVRSLE
jgi:glycosyltransferase involved in cell wall biosynthesis